jgi:hypothetical protein
MGKKFSVMRKKDFILYYGLKGWVKEPIGSGDPALIQFFNPTTCGVDFGWVCDKCLSSNLHNDLTCGFCDNPRPNL